MHFHGTADELAPFKGGNGKGTANVPAIFRPEFYSVDHSIQSWVKANGCATDPIVVKLPDKADDGMRVTRKTWSGSRALSISQPSSERFLDMRYCASPILGSRR